MFTWTRAVGAAVVPFLIAAVGILYFVPARTGELFAWPIAPAMTAMMLGAAYAGGIYFFTRVALSRSWHTVSLALLPVTAFVTYAGIATGAVDPPSCREPRLHRHARSA